MIHNTLITSADIFNLQTPCFVFEEDVFAENVNRWNEAFKKFLSTLVVGYSVKTNPLPYALKLALGMGCFAEVVSHDEYELVRLLGYPMDRIIYNGPMKSKKTFIEAVQGGAVVNIETHRELGWLDELPKDKLFKVGIRINVNIKDISPEDAKGGNSFSRFGFNEKTGELEHAFKVIESLGNVKLAGVHLHRSSKSRSINFYKQLTQYACDIIRKYRLTPEYIDMGGGFFGFFKDAPTFNDYAEVIASTLISNGLSTKTRMIFEPGNALLANAFYYVTEVIDAKLLPECSIITTNGSRNHIDPFFAKNSYMSEVLHQTEDASTVTRQIITGASCLEQDKLYELCDAPVIQIGDRIRYNNVGAYTLCLSPLFINYFPIVYALKDGLYSVIRDRWTAKEFVAKSIYEKCDNC